MKFVTYRPDKNSKPIPVLLDEALRGRITAASERIGEPQSTVMRMAMRLGLDWLEESLERKPRIEIPPPTNRAELNETHK